MPDIDFVAPIVPFAASSLLLKPIRPIAKKMRNELALFLG
jgi:hypothetical protein